MNRRLYSNWQLWSMSVGLLGIDFGWGLQMGNMSAIYEYLGAKPDAIPILWLAAPLTGLLVQPFIGYFSDRTWCVFGRRKPYFLGGALLSAVALLLMPLSTHLWMAALLLWLLGLSVNVSMGPFRALVPDLLPKEQITKGYIFQGIAISTGAVSAYALPWLLQHVFHMPLVIESGEVIPRIVLVSFWIGAVVFLAAILWTVAATKEFPPPELVAKLVAKGKDRRFGQMFVEVWHDIAHMPQKMARLSWAVMFSWMAFFCVVIYFPITVAHDIFYGATGTAQYLVGLEWADVCFATYSLCFLLFSLTMPLLAKKIARRTIYIIALLCGAISLMAILVAHNKWDVIVMMIGFGIAFAAMQTMPFAMLADVLPEDKRGIYMGIFNLFIVIPEIIVALGLGWVVKHLFHEHRIYGVVLGGIFMLIAAILALRVKDRSLA